MPNNNMNQSQPTLFQAGNRQIDRTSLENKLVQGINFYLDDYADVWGDKNTQAVRNAYGQIINAIHDGKVSMNIDGTLNINDGSIVNRPDKKGFDPVAKAAYYITEVINSVPDYKQQEKTPEVKKIYNTDSFAQNFLNFLAPPNSGVNINDFWAHLDDEVQDEQGNRSRPYTNRLKLFNQFLDQEITNLDNYTDVDEYWGDKDVLKQQLVDLRQKLADNDISLDDRILLTKLGFNSQLFDTTGTPMTDEERKAFEEKQTAEQAKLDAALRDKQARAGLLSTTAGVVGTDVYERPKEYSNYLAKKYGVGEKGFNAINAQIKSLLDKAYTTGLSPAEKRQLGNFLGYIRQNNPAYKDQILDPEEIADLGAHKSFKYDNSLIRLPWKTQDNRYIYSDSAGNIYFLKPRNNATFGNLPVTGPTYKRNFLSDASTDANGNIKAFTDNKTADYARIGSFIGDLVSLGGGWFNVAGTAVSSIGDWVADSESDESFLTKMRHLGQNVAFGVVGLIPFGKSSKFVAKWGKQANWVLGAMVAHGLISEGDYTYKMIQDFLSGKKKSFTSEDIKHLTQLGRVTTGGVATGRSVAAQRKWGDLTTVGHQVKTAKGETVKLTSKQKAEVEKIGNSQGQAKANEKFREYAEKNGSKLAEGDGLPSSTFKEKPTKWDKTSSRRIPYTQVRPGGAKIQSEKTELMANPENAEKLARLQKIRQETKEQKPTTFKEWRGKIARETGWGRGNENPGAFFDKYTAGLNQGPSAGAIRTASTTENSNNNREFKLNRKDNQKVIEGINNLSTTPVRNGVYHIQGKDLRVETGLNNTKVITFGDKRIVVKPNVMSGKVEDSEIKKEIQKLIKEERNLARKVRQGKGNGTKEFNISVKDLTELKRLGFLRIGGRIQKYQGGGVSHRPGSTWNKDVFSHNLEHILRQLGSYNKEKYARWINSMQDRHAYLYSQAKQGDFLTTPWENDSVRDYQEEYMNDPLADGERLNYGYNYGIDQAASQDGANRYVIASPNPNSGDWATGQYTPDRKYSGITDDRRILGREGDFSKEELAELNTKLKDLGFFIYSDKANGYNKLGFFDENGKRRIYTGDEGSEEYMDDDELEAYLKSDEGTLMEDGSRVLPDGTIIQSNGTRVNPDGSIISPEGTVVNQIPFDKRLALNDLIATGISITDLLNNIHVNNLNTKIANEALNEFVPADASKHYHQVMGDYAGNQFVNNKAAQLRHLRNLTSNSQYNNAVALDRERKAAEMEQEQAVRNQDMIQQHINTAEQYANWNRDQEVQTSNANKEQFFNIAQQRSLNLQDRNLANATSVSNFLKGLRRDFDTYVRNPYYQISEDWKSKRLGDRNSHIQRQLDIDPELAVLKEDLRKAETQEEKIRVANKIRARQAWIIQNAGDTWDKRFSYTYGTPYYKYDRDNWKRVLSQPQYRQGGTLTEAETLRLMRANDDRLMQSIWRAIDMYLKQKTRR